MSLARVFALIGHVDDKVELLASTPLLHAAPTLPQAPPL